MKFLLCNDDGYNAEGIKIVSEVLKKYGEVYIVAPRNHMSAKGCSISFGGIKVEKVNDNLFIVDGTPVDCVDIGYDVLKLDFDIVVSGCNHGLNITYDTMYSGTIGICLEALKFKKPAIAISAEVKDFELMSNNLKYALDYVFNNNLLSQDYFCSINFPTSGKVNDIKLTRLYYRNDIDTFNLKEDNLYYRSRIEEENIIEQDTDVYCVKNDIISITPLSKSFFNQEIFNFLKNSIK